MSVVAAGIKFPWAVVTVASLISTSTCVQLCSAQVLKDQSRPLVWVLSTGGTIAASGASSTDFTNYKSGSILGEDLIMRIPEIREHADVRVEQVVNVSSSDISLKDWLTIANRVNEIFSHDTRVAGIVITHGTNTMEETACFLNLTVKYD